MDLLREALRNLGRLKAPRAGVEASALFAFLIGALIVHQTGRLRMLQSDLDVIASSHLEALVSRLEGTGRE